MEMNNINNSQAPAKPANYLAFAIVSTILFFVPTGIVAIIKASQVDSLWAEGRYEEAWAMSASAKKFSMISLYIGLGIFALFILFYVFYFVFIMLLLM